MGVRVSAASADHFTNPSQLITPHCVRDRISTDLV